MKRPRFIILLFATVLVTLSVRAERIISEGDTWRFHNGFTFPGATWNSTNYDETAAGNWFSFSSGFGYGDGDDRTVLNDMTNNYAAFFTRKIIIVTNPAAVTRMTLGVEYDDGFVAWINGKEIARRNVTSNTINEATYSAGNHESARGDGCSNPQEKEFIAVTNDLSTLLAVGTNIIAVSCHNVSLTSSDATLIMEVYTNLTLVRGPFIQMPDTNAVTIVWRTDAPSDSTVEYGLDTSYTGGMVFNATAVREHVVKLPGLLPNTNYFYRVRSDGITLREGDLFRTRATAGQPFKFALIGDFGQGTAGMSNVANRVNVTAFDLFVCLGDNIYFTAPNGCSGDQGGQPGLYDPYWFNLYAPAMRRVPTMPVLGNHDIGTSNGFWQLNYFYLPTNGPANYLERNYSYDYGDVHFTAVDSNPFDLNDTTAIAAIKTWLSNDLASTSQPWKFVYLHHPAFSSGRENAGVKAHVIPIIDAMGVDVVFFGHDHFYERVNSMNGVYHIIAGDGGAGLSSPAPRLSTAKLVSVFGFCLVEMNGSRMKLTQLDTNGALIDEFNLDDHHPFKIDGLLDTGASNAWLRAQNGLRLYAAIRSNQLYLATQDAGEGSDHFIYLNNQLSTNRPANWAKAGTNMQWSAFLADENNSGFVGWFGNNSQSLTNFPTYQSMTSGTNNNAAANNGVLEGTIDLMTHFGSWPQQIYLAAAPYATADGGGLVTSAQVPAGNGDGNITSNEFLALNTRDIALDLPIANAGPDFSVLVNTPAQMNGAGSSAPSGATLAFTWSKLSGADGTATGTNSALCTWTPTDFVGAATNAVWELVVNDGRFDSDAANVTITVKNDSDQDGLTDDEETTGTDDPLTAASPNGNTSNPLVADTDGDGATDGQEALAGTMPNDSNSSFHILKIVPESSGGYRIEWSCVAGKNYRVQYRNDQVNGWTDLSGDISATTSITNIVDAVSAGQATRFYRVIIP